MHPKTIYNRASFIHKSFISEKISKKILWKLKMNNAGIKRYGSLKNLVAHYTNPLHLLGRVIMLAYGNNSHYCRTILLRMVNAYDAMYRRVFKIESKIKKGTN